jgi:hypothetical protein
LAAEYGSKAGFCEHICFLPASQISALIDYASSANDPFVIFAADYVKQNTDVHTQMKYNGSYIALCLYMDC